MVDVLQEFDEKDIPVPSRLRLIAFLRIALIFFNFFILLGMLIQIVEMLKTGDPIMFTVIAILTLLFGTIMVLSVFYNAKQLRLEFLLSNKCYSNNKLRWTSNASSGFILLAIASAFVMIYSESNVLWPQAFFILFSAVALICIIVLLADIRYYRLLRKDF